MKQVLNAQIVAEQKIVQVPLVLPLPDCVALRQLSLEAVDAAVRGAGI
jgi:hypothetical protein